MGEKEINESKDRVHADIVLRSRCLFLVWARLRKLVEGWAKLGHKNGIGLKKLKNSVRNCGGT